jgi:hypothetical protein
VGLEARQEASVGQEGQELVLNHLQFRELEEELIHVSYQQIERVVDHLALCDGRLQI